MFNRLNQILIKQLWGGISTMILPGVVVASILKPTKGYLDAERWGKGRWLEVNRVPEGRIWIHAASVGELSGVRPIVNRLTELFPKLEILVTTTSVTGRERAKQIQGVTHVLLLPLDNPILLAGIVERINPKLFLLAETELWPMLLMKLFERRVPCVIFNGRVSDNAWPNYCRLRGIFRPLLCQFSLVFAQSEIDRERLISLGVPAPNCFVSGSTKLDALSGEIEAELVRGFYQECGFTPEQPTLVFGSVWPDEIAGFSPVVTRLLNTFGQLQIIIAPRHPEKFDDAARELEQAGIEFVRRSGASSLSRLLLLDSLGELSLAYAGAQIAIVGGSFVKVGGHNPGEPAAFGIPAIMGSYRNNVKDLALALESAGGLFVAKDYIQAEELICSLLSGDEKRVNAGANARQVWQRSRGATDVVVQRVIEILGITETSAEQVHQPKLEERRMELGHAGHNSAIARLATIPLQFITRVRNRLYDAGAFSVYHSKLPVVSVGNVSLGGSGKSPCVRVLVESLLSSGRHPVILLRGYGGREGGPLLVNDIHQPADVGDEAVMHHSYFKQRYGEGRVHVVVSRRRVDGAKLVEAKELGDIIVLDDGLQHRALGRDIDLMLVGEGSIVVDGDLLQYIGPLRERPDDALKRAHGVVWVSSSGGSPPPALSHWTASGGVALFSLSLGASGLSDLTTGEQISAGALKGRLVRVVTAIAKPERFLASICSLGVRIESQHLYPDHHLFKEGELRSLWSASVPVIITEKDAVKIRTFTPPAGSCLVLRQEGEFRGVSPTTHFGLDIQGVKQNSFSK